MCLYRVYTHWQALWPQFFRPFVFIFKTPRSYDFRRLRECAGPFQILNIRRLYLIEMIIIFTEREREIKVGVGWRKEWEKQSRVAHVLQLGLIKSSHCILHVGTWHLMYVPVRMWLGSATWIVFFQFSPIVVAFERNCSIYAIRLIKIEFSPIWTLSIGHLHTLVAA